MAWRARMADSAGATTALSEKPACVFFKKSKGKKNARKRKAESSSSEDEGVSAVMRKEKKAIPAKQKTEGAFGFSSSKTTETDVQVEFKSTRSAMRAGPQDSGATATVEVDTEFDRDAQALFEQKLKLNKELRQKKNDDKVYRGMNNYITFIEKKDTALGNAASGMVR